MAPPTSSHYLDTAPSDNDDGSAAEEGYDSEAHEERKSKTARTAQGGKRNSGLHASEQLKQTRKAQHTRDHDGPRASKRRRLSIDRDDYVETTAKLDLQNEEDSEGMVQEDDSDEDDAAFAGTERAEEASDVLDEDDEGSDEDSSQERNGDQNEPASVILKATQSPDEDPNESASASASEDSAGLPIAPTLKRKRHSSPSTSITHSRPLKPKKTHKPGILYLPNPPPYLKPPTLRTLLQPYTKHGISRIFLTPEAQAARLARLKSGGNKKKLFTDGWVEFVSKRDAKRVVELLNGRTMGEIGRFVGRYSSSSDPSAGNGTSAASSKSLGKGAKKGSRWRDDVWSLRYLHGFKWGDLVGERRDEEAERGARMGAERRMQKRETEAFVRRVERSRVEKTRRERVGRRGGDDGTQRQESTASAGRGFSEGPTRDGARQREAVKKRAGERGAAAGVEGNEDHDHNGDLKRVLGKIF